MPSPGIRPLGRRRSRAPYRRRLGDAHRRRWILVRPLPFGEPSRLVMLSQKAPDNPRNGASLLNFLDWHSVLADSAPLLMAIW